MGASPTGPATYTMKANIKELRKYLNGITLRGVVEMLENLGSSQDPIMYMGKDTTPESLYYDTLNERVLALDIRISFWGVKKDGKLGWRRNSNFARMILDRMNHRNN